MLGVKFNRIDEENIVSLRTQAAGQRGS
jgi:hypothetical protein